MRVSDSNYQLHQVCKAIETMPKVYIQNLCIVLIVIYNCNGQKLDDVVEDIQDANRFEPDIIASRLYDYTTNTIAYKDKIAKKCYIQRMQKAIPLPLYISKSTTALKDVELLAGSDVVRFCKDLEVYKLLVPLRTKTTIQSQNKETTKS